MKNFFARLRAALRFLFLGIPPVPPATFIPPTPKYPGVEVESLKPGDHFLITNNPHFGAGHVYVVVKTQPPFLVFNQAFPDRYYGMPDNWMIDARTAKLHPASPALVELMTPKECRDAAQKESA